MAHITGSSKGRDDFRHIWMHGFGRHYQDSLRLLRFLRDFYFLFSLATDLLHMASHGKTAFGSSKLTFWHLVTFRKRDCYSVHRLNFLEGLRMTFLGSQPIFLALMCTRQYVNCLVFTILFNLHDNFCEVLK